MGTLKHLVLFMSTVFIAAGCKNAPSTDQCQQSFENIVNIEFASAGAKGEADMKDQIAKQKKDAMEKSQAAFMEICKDKTPKSVVECTIAAKTADQLAACDGAK